MLVKSVFNLDEAFLRSERIRCEHSIGVFTKFVEGYGFIFQILLRLKVVFVHDRRKLILLIVPSFGTNSSTEHVNLLGLKSRSRALVTSVATISFQTTFRGVPARTRRLCAQIYVSDLGINFILRIIFAIIR